MTRLEQLLLGCPVDLARQIKAEAKKDSNELFGIFYRLYSAANAMHPYQSHHLKSALRDAKKYIEAEGGASRSFASGDVEVDSLPGFLKGDSE